MNSNLPVLRCDWRRWLVICAVIWGAAIQVNAAEVSGVYADGGTLLESASHQTVEVPSLYAWLRLEFDPKVANVLRDQVGHVVLKHAGSLIDVEVYDSDGAMSWSKQWQEGEDFVQQDGRVILCARGVRFGNDEIILVLERLPDNELLQVTVQRVSPTMLGPAARKVGSALFHQMP